MQGRLAYHTAISPSARLVRDLLALCLPFYYTPRENTRVKTFFRTESNMERGTIEASHREGWRTVRKCFQQHPRVVPSTFA